MQGKIISFNELENRGNIVGSDGVEYIFSGDSWVEQPMPKVGDDIDFNLDSIGNINRMMYQSTAPRTGALADLANSNAPLASPPLQQTTQDRYAPPSQSLDRNFDNQHNSSLNAMYAEEQNYNMLDWTKKVVLQNYVNFKGRARRKEYWLFLLATTIVGFILGIIEGLAGIAYDEFSVMSTILNLALFVPSIAIGARRLHDVGRTGWWQLLWFIPIIGWILLIVWLASDTSPETNEWGAPARRM